MDDFTDNLSQLRERIERELVDAVPEIQPRSLYEPIRYFLDIGGKRLRPILLILSSKAVGGHVDQTIDAAVAIELLHNFTLVHDDIMDNDHLRRGHSTVHVRWDEPVAILAGDGLIGLAYRQLMKLPSQHLIPVCQIFTEGVIEVCEGQAFDKEFESKEDVDLEDYFRMIGKKTGRLITMATQIGAMLGGGSDEEVNILTEYGSIIGTAFQIQDDLLDIMASEEVIGKTFGSDVMAGKKTYLMVKSLQLSNTDQRKRVFDILHSAEISQEMLYEIRQIFKDTNILTQAERDIKVSFEKANRVLDSFPHPERARALHDFSEMLLKRKY